MNNGKLTNIDDIRILIPTVGSILGLIIVGYLAKFRVLNAPKGEKHMIEIADAIKLGAKAFLHKEYIFLTIFVILIFIFIGVVTGDWEQTGVSFLLGAFLSALCGYCGMLIAVEANVRTAEAAKKGLNDALKVSFASGGVMGLSVVCVGILGLTVLYAIWGGETQHETNYLAGFGFGASSIALFARVGGGIYTKAADVGADLVGKVQSNIPEDDPRNPATIADNVGDNVGDVAGMGADLFESFVGSIIAAIQLSHDASIEYGFETIRFISLPFCVSGFGIISSIIGIFLIRTKNSTEDRSHDSMMIIDKSDSDRLQKLLLSTIRRGILTSSILSLILSYVSCLLLFGYNNILCYKIWGCIVTGLICGELIGVFTEYTTSQAHKPTKSIAKKSRIGSAGVVIQGLSIGMLSTFFPVLIIIIAINLCYGLSGNYGIAMAAVGMLSTLGVTLATDAFGPVSDNAGGIAEMAQLDESVRMTTDGLDSLGNTTAATGKGFCIGSAVLTALALLSAYKSDANLTNGIDLSKPEVLSSAIFGACLPYLFAALTMMAVGRAAALMIREVLRQFNEYELLSENPKRKPDYQECVKISTQASIIEMIIPGVLAVCSPLFIGFLLGTESLGGMLIGSIISGFMLAIFMANSGGAWDNAKKFIEANGLGISKGKHSSEHKAAIVGDTIGDPFKDTAGPSLDILFKMMSMISLVFTNVFSNKPYDKNKWYIGLIVFFIFIIIAGSVTFWMRKTGFGKTPIPVQTPNEHEKYQGPNAGNENDTKENDQDQEEDKGKNEKAKQLSVEPIPTSENSENIQSKDSKDSNENETAIQLSSSIVNQQ